MITLRAMSATETALTGHLIVSDPKEVDDGMVKRAVDRMREKFGIERCTLQIESGDPAHPCSYCVPVPSGLKATPTKG